MPISSLTHPALPFGKLAKSPQNVDVALVTDHDDSLGQFDPNDFGGRVKNQREINRLGKLIYRSPKRFWVIGDTSRSGASIGIWQQALKHFPMHQIIVDEGKSVFNNPSRNKHAGQWLQNIQDKKATADTAWTTHIKTTFGWDFDTLCDAFNRHFQTTLTKPAAVTPALQQLSNVDAQRLQRSFDLNSLRTLDLNDNAQALVLLPRTNSIDAFVNIPNAAGLDHEKINAVLSQHTQAFIDHCAPKAYQDEFGIKVYPHNKNEHRTTWVMGPKLKRVSKATYLQHQLHSGAFRPKKLVLVGDSGNDIPLLFSPYTDKDGKPVLTYPILRVNYLPTSEQDAYTDMIMQMKAQPNGRFIVPRAHQAEFIKRFAIDTKRVHPDYPSALQAQVKAK